MTIFASLTTIPYFAAYFAVALALLWLFKAVYLRITPYQEISLIRAGNIAAAVSLGGALLGFTVALASVIVHSVNLIDLAIWGVIALLVQTLAYVSVRLLIRDVAAQIQNNSLPHGVYLGMLSLCCGILNGACMTP